MEIKKFFIRFIPSFIRRQADEAQINLIFDNMFWLVLDKILRILSGLVIGVWVARYLGPAKYGQLNYAISFVGLFSPIALLGLYNVVVRDLIRNPDRKYLIMGSSLALKIMSAAASIILAVSVQYLIEPGGTLELILVSIIALGFIFQTFDVIEYWFQSLVMSKYVIWAKGIGVLVSIVLRIIFILTGAGIVPFAIVVTLDLVCSAVGLVMVYRAQEGRITQWKPDPAIMKSLVRDSWPYVISAAAGMTYMRIDQIFIKTMLNDGALGLYSAAVRLAEVWYFIPTAITSTAFPYILKAKAKSEELYRQRLQLLYDLMTIMSFAVCIFVTVFSDEIILLLYGEAYAETGTVLAIYFWAGWPLSLTIVATQFIISENYNRIAIYRAFVGSISNIALNLLLIPRFGIVGAAWATILSYSLMTMSIIMFGKTRGQAYAIIRSVNPLRLARLILTVFHNRRHD